MWCQRLSKAFGPEVRQRGTEYAMRKRVKSLSVGPTSLSATVTGTQDYFLFLERDQDEAGCDVCVQCTCPYDDLCKHAWAAIISAIGEMEETWGASPKKVYAYREWPDDESAPRPARAVPIAGPKKPQAPEWKRLLNETRPNEWTRRRSPVDAASPIEGRVWYVVDAPRSSQSGMMVLSLMGEPHSAENPGAAEGNDTSDIRGLRRLSLVAGDVERIARDEDRAICALLIGAARPSREYDPFAAHSERYLEGISLWKVDPRMLSVVMPMMQRTGRLCWRGQDERTVFPLRWAPHQSWRLGLEIRAQPLPPAGVGARRTIATQHVLVPCVMREDRRVPLGSTDAVCGGSPGLVLMQGELGPLHASREDFGWSLGLLHRRPVRVGREDLVDLLTEFGKSGLDLEVAWPESWGVRVVADVMPTGRLTLKSRVNRYERATFGYLFGEVEFVYGQATAGSDVGTYLHGGASDGVPVLIRRHAERERALVTRATASGGKRDPYTGRWLVAEKKVAELATLLVGEGWEVRGEKGLYRPAGEVRIDASSGIDWFEVRGSVTFGEASASIAAVLDALKNGHAFVSLGDGSLGMLPEQWLEKHARWLAMGRVEGEGVRFSKAQVSLVDALLAQIPEATCDAQVAAARTRLRSFEGIAPRKEPPGFRGTLRPYQRDGLGWLRYLGEFGFGGCLADDMGLGKTVQLLAHILDQHAQGTRGTWMVVAPKSLMFNWAREAEKFAPRLNVLIHAGGERADDRGAMAKADLVLTTYATMRLDLELLRTLEFEGVVLDEAQAIKNPASQVAKAVRLLQARRRVALTGTPVENRIDDLWSIFEFLNPGMLSSLRIFQEAMRSAPVPRGMAGSAPPSGNTPGDASGPSEGSVSLRRALRPFLLRRTKAVVAPELPARTEQVVACELEGRQKILYNSLRKHYQAQLLGRVEQEGMGKNRIHVLEALLRLRQAACHPALIEPKSSRVDSSKVSTLIEMLVQVAQEGHKSLVFSQFTALLALVRGELDERGILYEYLDGKTSSRQRAEAVDRFQGDGAGGVFLISLKAGGTGLNLTAAGYVFLLDPWWNPAVEAQAIDRAHRIGQNKSVLAYRLIAKDTVEERILELQRTKRELAEAIVAEQDGPLASMTAEDLSWLLS